MKSTVKLRTIIAVGAVGQILLLKFLPHRLAILPAALLSLHAVITTAVQIAHGPRNAYMEDVIAGRSTAQLPSPETGAYGSDPAAHPMVVFHFGVRFNHPLGLLSPGAREIGEHFQRCLEAVQQDAESYGLLGVTDWRSNEVGPDGTEKTNGTILQVYYFRDVVGLHRFAHSEIHRAAWDWAARTAHPHIGFFHETFCVPSGAGAYENIYVNMPPTLLGQARIRREGVGAREGEVEGDGEQELIGTLVSADTGPLSTMVRRLGYTAQEELPTTS